MAVCIPKARMPQFYRCAATELLLLHGAEDAAAVSKLLSLSGAAHLGLPRRVVAAAFLAETAHCSETPHCTAAAAMTDSHSLPSNTAFVDGPPPDPDLVYDQASLSPEPFAKAVEAEKRPSVCDELGRIDTAKDGHTCDGDDACVNALPSDFCERVGGPPDGTGFCYRWAVPPGGEGYWEDQSRSNLAGRPWCVKAKDLKTYAGPIEIMCSASGPGARVEGSPTGCWWLKEFAEQDVQRLSGPIRMSGRLPKGTSPELYVQDAPGVRCLTEKQAEHWVLNGSLGPLPDGGRRAASSQFLPPVAKQ